MSALGIILFVFVGWLVCSIGYKLACVAIRCVPATIVIVAVLASLSLMGNGCDHEPRSRAKTVRVKARRAARPPAVESDSAALEMPKRAGEVPVAAELAANAPAQPIAPQAATAAQPVVIPTPPAAAAPAAIAPPVASVPATVIPAAVAPATVVPATVAPAAVVPATVAPAVITPTAAAPRVSTATVTVPTALDVARPAWIEAPARLVNGTYSLPVKSGLYASLPECQRALDVEMKREADHYINEYLGDAGAAAVVDIPIDYLKNHVKKGEYSELIKSESVGPMHQIHALLEFDAQAQNEFRQRKHDAVVDERLWVAGAGAGMVLAVLGTLYGYLKLESRSGRTRFGRTKLAATLVALLVAAGVLLLRWAVP